VGYLQPPSKRPAWLCVESVLGEHGILKDSAAGRQQFERRVEERGGEESQSEFKAIRRGWGFGNGQFRKEVLGEMREKVGGYHYGPEVQESAEEKANRIVAEELRRRKWMESDLGTRRKGEAGKVEIARRLRAETMTTLNWIAQRLHTGTKTHLA